MIPLYVKRCGVFLFVEIHGLYFMDDFGNAVQLDYWTVECYFSK